MATFIDGERRCCPFFMFQLDLAPAEGEITLRITGGPEAKRIRALRNDRVFAGVIRNDVEAQQALVRQTVVRASRSVSIAAEVQQAVASKGVT